MPRVVVGFDGPEVSDLAVRDAVRQAVARDVPLRIVTVWGPPFMDMGTGYPVPMEGEVLDAISSRCQDLVDRAVAAVRAEHPELPVEGQVVTGSPAEALLDQSTKAELLVVGTHGRGGHRGMMLGSVSRAVAEHAKCPVLIVRPDPPEAKQRIVVGIDGSDCARRALETALEWGDRMRLPVHVVHAWSAKAPMPTSEPLPQTDRGVRLADIHDAAVRTTAEILAGHQPEHPDVRISQEAVQGSPSSTLIALSEQACLVVVGSRGRGGFRRLLLGSTSHQVITHAHCSVCVVH